MGLPALLELVALGFGASAGGFEGVARCYPGLGRAMELATWYRVDEVRR